MTQPFMLRQQYQTQANALPGQMFRAGVLNAGGQNEDMRGPWAAMAANINQDNHSLPGDGVSYGGYPAVSSYDPARTLINDYQGQANGFSTLVPDATTLGLGKASGSMMRQYRTLRGPGCTSCAQGVYGLGAAASGASWYENPLYLGAGAVAILGAVWFLSKK